MAVAMIGIVLMLVLIPLLGKYQDISHQTLLASRYVAWQATVQNDIDGSAHADADQTLAEVRKRFFADPLAPIRSGDAPQDDAGDQRALWVDHGGHPLLDSFDDVYVSYGNEPGSVQPADGYTGAADTGALFRAGVKPDDYQLRDHGLYRGVVTVSLANLPYESLAPFDALGLKVMRQTNLLPGAWTASSPGQVRERITSSEKIFSTTVAKSLAAAAQPLMFPLESGKSDEVAPPQLGETEFWEDMVPEDRLPEGAP